MGESVEFSMVAALVSTLKSPIITIIDITIIRRFIKDKEVRNASIFLMSLGIAALLGIVINYLGGYLLSPLEILFIGVPASFVGGQIGHRASKITKIDTKIKEKVTNGKKENRDSEH